MTRRSTGGRWRKTGRSYPGTCKRFVPRGFSQVLVKRWTSNISQWSLGSCNSRSPSGRVRGRRTCRSRWSLAEREERQLLNVHVASLRQACRDGCFPDEPLIREILARRRHIADAERLLEVRLDLRAGPRFAYLAQMIEHRRKDRRRPLGDVHIERVERGPHLLRRLLRVQ